MGEFYTFNIIRKSLVEICCLKTLKLITGDIKIWYVASKVHEKIKNKEFSSKNILQKYILRKNTKSIKIRPNRIQRKRHYMGQKKGYFMIKYIDWYENRAVMNLYMLHIRASKCIKQKNVKMWENFNTNLKSVGELFVSFFGVWKIKKMRGDLLDGW